MSSGPASTNPLQEMIPLLMDVQRNLDRDLDLQSLAGKYGYSPFHFQRLFSNAMGETPKEYVQRLRLEKAAYKLQITDESIFDICLSVGFKNHETFTRPSSDPLAPRRAIAGKMPRFSRLAGLRPTAHSVAMVAVCLRSNSNRSARCISCP